MDTLEEILDYFLNIINIYFDELLIIFIILIISRALYILYKGKVYHRNTIHHHIDSDDGNGNGDDD